MKCRVICMLLAAVLIGGCSSAPEPQPAPEPKAIATVEKGPQKVYIDEMPRLFTTAAGRKLMIPVTGNLPNPAYQLDTLRVDRRDDVVEITPLARYDDSLMVTQVLVPFSRTVAIGPFEPGEYHLRFNSRSGVQDAKIIVE